MLLLHPHVATRNCDHCQKYAYDETTGEVEKRAGQPIERAIYRGASIPPCRDPKRRCPKGTPEEPKALTPENVLAYWHYRECRAVGSFPDDAIVRRNADVIRSVEDLAARKEQSEFRQLVLLTIGR